jgi:hypothetical protein
MPLLIKIGKKMSGNGSMEFIEKQVTHKPNSSLRGVERSGRGQI